MSMTKRIKNIINIVVIFCLIIGIQYNVGRVLEPSSSRDKYQGVLNGEEYDVILVGNSHMLNSVSPMYMWNSYGITSYNIACASLTIPSSYWALMNSLDYVKPKVVVIDGYMLDIKEKINPSNYSSLHGFMDAFPLSVTKVKAAYDLLDDDISDEEIEEGLITIAEKRTPVGLLWNYSVYHNRWNELSQDDFTSNVYYDKGAYENIAVVPMTKYTRDEQYEQMDTVAVDYLKLLVESCNERGIEVMFTYVPSPAYNQPHANYMDALAKEMGVECVNFYEVDIVNYQTDFSINGHMNPSGMRKVSEYLGGVLQEKYGLSDKKKVVEYDSWNLDYAEFVQYEYSTLKAQNSIYNYLMYLYDLGIDVQIDVDDMSNVLQDELLLALLDNLGITIDKLYENVRLIEISSDGNVSYESKNNGDYNSGVDITVTKNDSVIDKVRFEYYMSESGINVIRAVR